MMEAGRNEEAARRYVSDAQPVFDALHEVATRLAGLLMSLEMLKSRHVLDIESRLAARTRLDRADAERRRLRPPAVAAHFHHHLTDAARKLAISLDAIDDRLAGLISAGDPLPPLRSAWRDIEAASHAIPGFETVDFQQSCCAMHRTPDNSGGRNGRVFDLDS
ncbi:hypothetical protein [Shinella sp.]|uniref:hypothetical protein n=1 Tax=Shinella sp. TaxID=1870904 RepID=UPI0029A8EDCA|nr:hypothetical protein [Shinella sp.]MDX3977410.1 hypothetical protein [Shinella sp.]